MIWREEAPSYPIMDTDAELEMALRQPFTAMALALRKGHHPRLWARVYGTPFEGEYRRLFHPETEEIPSG